ncbi:hypothetical protein THRCLA_21065 [Thraustotheca clavata]|uniref:TNFR-Cys domain-containing protein n=1 Tax=Thraustotheca clavata TaxID=74557 RepID=A0A1W0A0L3_9STRA|nr:hypothetical protein THRCLA_21065 [Thraustotheca clavata]
MRLLLLPLTAFLCLTNGLSPGRIQFSPTQYSATNQWGSIYLVLQRALGSDGPAAVFLNTNNGSALSGIDFIPLQNRSVSWVDTNWASVQIPIAFISRVLTQDLTFSVTMTPTDNTTTIYTPMATAFITIQAANLYPGDLCFTTPTINVTIPPLTLPTTPISVSVPVGRFNGSYGSIQVQYALAPIANLPPSSIPADGIDFKIPSTLWGNYLLWQDGDNTTKSIVLNVFNIALYRNTKQLAFSLYFPTGGSKVLIPSTAIINIVGNIQDAPTGVLLLQAPCFPSCPANTYTIQEGGAVRVFVQRQNGTFGSVSVQYSVLPDPSTNTQANVDIIPISGTLSWVDGDTSSQFFVVQTKRSSNPKKQAVIKIYQPTGGATILPIAASSVLVINSMPAPLNLGGEVDFIVKSGIQLSLSKMPLASDQVFQIEIDKYQSGIESSKTLVVNMPGNITFIVRRARGSLGAASVYVQTISQTSIAGVDYVAVGQLLLWADGDTRDIPVDVTILSPPYTNFNGMSTVPKTLSIALTNPSTVILGSFSQYLVLLKGTQQVPSLVGFTLDMTAKLLILQYSFPVLAATANVALLTLQSSVQQGTSYTLTSNSIVIADADPAIVRISLHPIDRNGIENQVGLAQATATTFITYSPGFVQYPIFNCASTAVNGCVVPPLPAQQPYSATNFNSDTLSPTLVRFVFDGQYLLLRFSKVIDPQTILMNQIRLCDSNTFLSCATLSTSSYIVQGTRSGGPNTLLPSSPGDGTLITIFVGPADQALIKSTGSGLIGVAATSTFIIVSNQIQDIFRHPLLPPFAIGAGIAPDCSPCPTNSYASQRCSDISSRICTPCTVCPFDYHEKNACTPTRDRICQRIYIILANNS